MTKSNTGADVITIGKIPGQLHELAVDGKKKICELFGLIGIKDLSSCEIQRNGSSAGINEYVEAGDTILAVAKIRGN